MEASALPARRNKQTRGQGRTSRFPRLLGGRLCLHFANTVEAPRSDHPHDFLAGYADLVEWSRHAGILAPDEAERLPALATAQNSGTGTVFARAVGLRTAIDRAFRAIAQGERPQPRDLETVRSEHASALAVARLVPRGTGYRWSWDHVAGDPAAPLYAVAESAVRLLTEGQLDRIRECPGAGDCGWLFYDTSRNGRRRWCSMEGCGSRVKMRRRYARSRARPPRNGDR